MNHNRLHPYILATMCLILLLPAGQLYGQVDAEAMRISVLKNGLIGKGTLNANLVKGNVEYFVLSGQLRFDYKRNEVHAFFIANSSYGELAGDKFQNDGFVHARIVESLNHRISVEAFAQSEFNDFLNIKNRLLGGGGLRLLLAESTKKAKLHLGVAAMYEAEDYTDPLEEDKHLARSTNYLTGDFYINDKAALSLTGYFQPDIGNTADYRILLNTSLDVQLSERFTFTANIHYRLDSEPLRGLKDYDMGLSNGISFTF